MSLLIMEPESVLNLLDSYWYDLDFFKRKPTKTSSEPNNNCNSSSDVTTLSLRSSSEPNNNNNSQSDEPRSYGVWGDSDGTTLPSRRLVLSSSESNSHHNSQNELRSCGVRGDSDGTVLPLQKLVPSPHHKTQEIPTALPTIQTKSSSPSSYPKVGTSISQQRSDSASPNSVLFTPKLQTIFSGKEQPKLEYEDSSSRAEMEFQEVPISTTTTKTQSLKQMRRKKKGFSKSLSDLEYQELKGFMDLGFVFSEEDKDSTLGSILPGLHRLGQQSESNIDIGNFVDEGKMGNNFGEKFTVSRPYLSESWDVLDKNKGDNSLLNWKVPASVSNSEIDMKDYLKFWAHSVASTFR